MRWLKPTEHAPHARCFAKLSMTPVWESGTNRRGCCLLPPSDGNVFLRIGGPNVIRAGADQAVVVELLDHVGGPAADSGDGKYWGE